VPLNRRLVALVLRACAVAIGLAAVATTGDPCESSLLPSFAALAVGACAAAATFMSVTIRRSAAAVLSLVVGVAVGGGLFFFFLIQWVENCTA
jgi:hypothetical protein